MLFIVKPLVRLRDRRWLAKEANALASQLTDKVTPTLSSQVLQMSQAEARGYIRAKCRPIVEAEFKQLAANRPGLVGSAGQTAIEAIIERVIRMALDDVAHGRVQHGPQRKAA